MTRLFLVLRFSALLLLSSSFLQGQDAEEEQQEAAPDSAPLLWRGTGDTLWSAPENWESAPPLETESRRVLINTPATIALDRETQVLTGGLLINRSRTNVTIDLSEHRLILSSGAIELGGGRSTVEFKNGTLQIGSANSTVALVALNKTGTESRLIFSKGLTFETLGLESLIVGQTSGVTPCQGAFDLSQVTLSGGTLRIRGECVIGQYAELAGARAVATRMVLRLPPMNHFSMRDLTLARNSRNQGAGPGASVEAGLEFSPSSTPLRWEIGRLLVVAAGDATKASISGLPAGTDWSVGSNEEPGVIRVGFKDRSQGPKAPDAFAHGEAIGNTGGRFDAVLHELRLGQNTRTGGGAKGILDLSRADACSIELRGVPQKIEFFTGTLEKRVIDNKAAILNLSWTLRGVLAIGVGPNAEGTLKLPPGKLSTAWAIIGDESDGSSGLLELHGTQCTVRDALELGVRGKIIAVNHGKVLPNLRVEGTFRSTTAGALKFSLSEEATAGSFPATLLEIKGLTIAELNDRIAQGHITVELPASLRTEVKEVPGGSSLFVTKL